MTDELDPRLLVIFERARQPLADSEFVRAVIAQIERQQRRALIGRTLVAAAVGVPLGWASPAILRATAAAFSFLAESSDALSPMLSSAAWAAALLVGAAVLRRCLRLR